MTYFLQNKSSSLKLRSRAKAIDLNELQKVDYVSLLADGSGPLMICQNTTVEVNLFGWLDRNRQEWQSRLNQHGALVFRGFNIDSIPQVEKFSALVLRDVYKDNKEHQPVSANGEIQIPVEYAKKQKLLWHNENTFNHCWPGKAIFACEKPATSGGETPLVDSRVIYRKMLPEIRDEFAQKGVMYMRRYSDDGYMGLSWRQIFNTEDKKLVEAKCRQNHIHFEWREDDVLVTKSVRPAVWQHPVTYEWSWINQAQHWHFSCLGEETCAAIAKLYSEKDYPRNCYFGDGSKIDDEYMRIILELYAQHEVSFSWQRGDVALVDNILMAHSRNAYEGDRRILVCFGDQQIFTDK